ncbi:hypothetical protein ATKI12_4112 [Kitasatospora sp. Ki12]
MTGASPEPVDSAAYFDLRARLLGPLRNRPLTSGQLCEVGRIVCGHPDGLSLYGIPAPRMAAHGIRLLGRTALECVKDPHPALVAAALTDVLAGLPVSGARPVIADLFCGSGNLGHQLGRLLGPRFGHRVLATELDPLVHAATRHNLTLVDSPVRLHHAGYRDLLHTLAATFRDATALRTLLPRPVRRRGMNAAFHLYRV